MLIQLIFISNGVSLIDAPHRIMRWAYYLWHKYKQKYEMRKQPFVDTIEFDISYAISYSMTIFFVSLLFSTLVPIIPFFAFLYFLIKHNVDKYNLVFNYYSKFESGGKTKNNIVRYLRSMITMYMLIMIAFFSFKDNHHSQFYSIVGFILTLTMLILF